MSILFIDSEGCKSVDKNNTHDAKIFAILILLSSLFIYNSKGAIDEQAINQLSLATCLSELISTQTSSHDTEEEMKSRISALAPKFLWLLRDFHLTLIDEDGSPITAHEYMENILNMRHVFGRNPEKQAHIRQEILDIFKDRDCMTLPRPAEEEKILENLSNINKDKIRPKFLKNIQKLKKNVKNCPVKKINGTEINGKILLGLLDEYLKALNNGIIPNINTS